MKKALTLILCLSFALVCFSQKSFEKGYFVDGNGGKIECYIKSFDHLKTSKNLKYKLSENSKTKIADLNTIKEVFVYNSKKFIKRKVFVKRESKLNEEEIFLKVLVEGKANLYSFHEEANEIFFFSTNDLEIEQLIFEKNNSKIDHKDHRNNKYKKQLFNKLVCETITFKTANNLKYERKYLINFFTEYNSCEKSNSVVYDKKAKVFTINLRPKLNFTSFTLDERGDRLNPRSINFGNKNLLGFGLEFEAVLPFLSNKWAVALEPSYEGNYSDEIIFENDANIGESVILDYTSLNVALTIRHYFYINNNSKIFLNGSFVSDFPSGSIVYKVRDVVREELKPSGSVNFAIGAGFKFNNKFSVEARYYTNRNTINHLIDYSSTYNMASIILGYTIF